MNYNEVLNPETAKQLLEACDYIAKTIRQLAETIKTLWEKYIKPLLDKILTTKALIPKTPYKRKLKFRLFDKRVKIHHCRNNC